MPLNGAAYCTHEWKQHTKNARVIVDEVRRQLRKNIKLHVSIIDQNGTE